MESDGREAVCAVCHPHLTQNLFLAGFGCTYHHALHSQGWRLCRPRYVVPSGISPKNFALRARRYHRNHLPPPHLVRYTRSDLYSTSQARFWRRHIVCPSEREMRYGMGRLSSHRQASYCHEASRNECHHCSTVLQLVLSALDLLRRCLL